MKIAKRIIITLAILYIATGLLFYFIQHRFLLKPVELGRDESFDITQPYQEKFIDINDKEVIHLLQFLPAGNRDSVETKGLLLYFHGNRGHSGVYSSQAELFTRNGYEVWMMDYPGFGKSQGDFREEEIYQWAGHVYRFARSRFSADSIIVYGRSLGSGIASQLASTHDIKLLILETPYYSMESLVKHYLPIYPVSWLLKNKFPTSQFLKKVEVPVIIFHGTEDDIIPYKNAVKLEPLLGNRGKFITIPGGEHNDLSSFRIVNRTIDSLLH